MTIQEKVDLILHEKTDLNHDFKQFNAYIQKKKKITGNDVVSICKVLKITPNELFGYSKKENTTL